MNDLKWMSKAEFFEALDSPTNENDSVVFKQMNLFGPYYIQDLSFKQCLEYPKDINHVTYKDRLPMYRMCDLAYPMDNPLGKETKPLRKLCIEKCKELQRCKSHTAQAIAYEMCMFIKDIIDNRFSPTEEGVMQAYHPIVPYQGTVSRYEAESSISNKPDEKDKKKIKKITEESTDSIMSRIGPRIVNPDLSDTLDMDYGFGTLGDKYNQSATESLEKACAQFHLIAYGRYANDNDKVMEGFSYFDNPDWVNDEWDNVLEAITDATTNVPPSVPTVNQSLSMKKSDDDDKVVSDMNRKKKDTSEYQAQSEEFNIDKFRQFIAVNQRYTVSPSAFTDFMNYAKYDHIVGYINDGPVLQMNETNLYVMPIIDVVEGNKKKLLVYDTNKGNIDVEPFPSEHNIT